MNDNVALEDLSGKMSDGMTAIIAHLPLLLYLTRNGHSEDAEVIRDNLVFTLKEVRKYCDKGIGLLEK